MSISITRISAGDTSTTTRIRVNLPCWVPRTSLTTRGLRCFGVW
jgi:hypothetical protein